jgi:D-lactate dehydrogenase (cytochrome)
VNASLREEMPVRTVDTGFHVEPGAIAQAVAFLQEHFADRVNVSQAVREHHARGEGLATSLAPDAVVWPADKYEVSAILARCNALGVPVIAFGAGSSVEGHVSAPYGGICMDLSRMDAVLDVHAEDSDCVVQPGVTRESLNAYLKGTGLFFPVDPGANATLGGMVSTRASGTTTMRYGSMAHNVMALEVAMADGRLLRPGAFDDRRRGNARCNHRNHPAPASAARSGIGGELRLSDLARGDCGGERTHDDGHAVRADRVPR